MRKIFYGAFFVLMASLAWNVDAAAPAKKKTTAKKTTANTTKKSPPKTAAKSPSKGSKKAPVKQATTWRNRQAAPSQDRYREIQTALAAKGYLSAEEATGNWGPSSVEALKRFQAEQNLDASGKINSLSLIALGLGPKRDNPVVVPPPDPAR